jgi:hypothetical protein
MKTRKGAIGIPMEVLVGLVIALVIIAFALVFYGVIPGITGPQTDRGYLESCCIGYKIAGKCAEGAADANYQCTIKDGKTGISELAGRAGLTLDYCCR